MGKRGFPESQTQSTQQRKTVLTEDLTWDKGLMLGDGDAHERPTASKDFELPGGFSLGWEY